MAKITIYSGFGEPGVDAFGMAYRESVYSTGGMGAGNDPKERIGLDASRWNSSYVDNGTVRPQSLSVLVLLRL